MKNKECKLKKSTVIVGILIVVATLGCIATPTEYDAIDLVPETLEGYMTMERNEGIHISEGQEGCFSKPMSSAGGAYSKGSGFKGYITVFECESEEAGQETLQDYVQSGGGVSEIELEKGIRAKLFLLAHYPVDEGGTMTPKTTPIIVWQERNFIFNLFAVDMEADSTDNTEHLANSLIRQSPL